MVLALILAPLVYGAEQQRDPIKPATSAVSSGSAVVAGRVTSTRSDDTPVRRAVVSLTSTDGTDHRSVVTDNDGRFAFRALPPGRYTLAAQKPAHLKTSYGAQRPGRPGTALVVTDGQQVTSLRVILPKGAVIAGTLRTEDGEPLTNTQVMAIPVALATAGGSSIGPAQFSTDDQGDYRIFGLMPGAYIVAALPAVGRGEVQERSDEEYEAIVRALSQRLSPGAAAPTATPPPPVTTGFAPTYYPGTPVATQAVLIKIGAGEAREGIDIPVTMFRMSTLAGTIIGTNGAPTRAVQLTTEAVGPTLPLSNAFSIRNSIPDAQGRFTISNVPPGSYRITARAGGITLNADGSMQSSSMDAQTEWAVADVQVTGENVDGITLALRPGMTFSGHLTAAGTGAGPVSWKGTRVSVQPVGRASTGTTLGASLFSGTVARTAAAADDGDFMVTGIQPGNYEILIELPVSFAADWRVRSMVSGTRDLRDSPLTFEDGSLANVAVTVTNQPSVVTGTLSAAAGAPAADYYVMLFPADRSLWHPASPRVKVVRPGVDGMFNVTGLPSGEYRIAALTDVEEDDWRSSAFLESLIPTSITITVRDGATTRQDIRIR